MAQFSKLAWLLRGCKRRIGHLTQQPFLLFCGAMLIVLVIFGDALLISHLKQWAVRDGKQQTKHFSYVMAEETERTFEAVRSAAVGLTSRFEESGMATTRELELQSSGLQMQEVLRAKMSGLPYIDSISIISSDGRLINRARLGPIPEVDLSDREYLTGLRNAPNIHFYVGTPSQSRTTGRWSIFLAQRISGPNGEFLGAVVGVMEFQTLEDHYERIALGTHGSITMGRSDGILLARYPRVETLIGTSVADIDLFESMRSEPNNGVIRRTSTIDGVDRLMAFTAVPHFPVVMIVTMSMEDVLIQWEKQSAVLIIVGMIISLVIALGVILAARRTHELARRTRELARATSELGVAREREQAQAALKLQYDRFDAAISNMGQGLVMFDGSERLIVCNRKYVELYQLPPELTRAGTPWADILNRRSLAGNDKLCSPMEEPAIHGDTNPRIRELRDGRIIAISHQEMRGGGWVSTHEDITERRHAEERIAHMAGHDALTDLPNRFRFRERLGACLSALTRGDHFALLYLDLDRFKIVNDSFGHPVGDALLKEVTSRLKSVIRDGDSIARLGGDEFAIIQRLRTGPADAAILASRIIDVISEPYQIGENEVVIGTTIGISLAPEDTANADQIIRNADMALYFSKGEQRGSYHFFEPKMEAEMLGRRNLEIDLRRGFSQGEFELYYQPLVSMKDQSIIAFESLLRWNHPERGLVPPDQFIPLMEEVGLIVPVGEWVVRQACMEAVKWPGHIKVAVNVSVAQFKSPKLVACIADALRETGLAAERLEIEVTESLMLQDGDDSIAILHQLRDMGIRISMDDFGTGFSSLSYLRRFPFDKLKIDKSFVRDLATSQECAAIVRAATSLAASLGMTTTAEGVETGQQLRLAGIEGCTEAQGYLIGRPKPANEIPALLRASARDQKVA